MARYEFIIDSKYKIGTQIVRKNLDLPVNIKYDNTNVVMRFTVQLHTCNIERRSPANIEM